VTTVDIACASDDRYAAHTAAMLHSLRWHARGARLRVHFLAGPELSPSPRGKLAAMARSLDLELAWVEVPEALMSGLPARDYLSRVVWHRVFMPELLPQLDRVLYLDSDVIAMESAEPLWATVLDTEYFAAVTNVVPRGYAHRAEKLGLPGAGDYFNLGVALWNLRLMRQEGFSRETLAYARQNLDSLPWLEQDAINALYWRRRKPLHPRWNCQNGIYDRAWGTTLLDPVELREAIERPALLHFEGGTFAKPWHFLSQHPLRGQYAFHRSHTPWPRWVAEGITARNVLKKYLPKRALALLRSLRA